MQELDAEISYFRIILARDFEKNLLAGEPLPADAIRDAVIAGPFEQLTPAQRDIIVRELEGNFTTSQTLGSSVRSDYTPWLSARRGSIDFFYWKRLNQFYLAGEHLPPSVVSVLDNVTDEILDYCGNPEDVDTWARRGMVMGHVQSGKTTNYAALICKAADAGYKIIILLAGITNSLRSQTQERLDETFIGKVSAFSPVAQETLPITNYGGGRFPAYGTSRDHDFQKRTAANYGVTLAALNEPTIFVTKKNKATLGNLRDWLVDQNHGGLIKEPLLLIDDEADNASVNTAKDPKKTTAINKAIREILALFQRTSYVGYTATPFANIFIDPDTEDEMLKDDLFPRHFIKALDPPSNYVGASRVFNEEGDLYADMVRIVDDFQDVLPLKHKRDHDFSILPQSLFQAVRLYFLTRAIRILRKQGEKHCSMMINVSRFNDVQENIHGLVYAYLVDFQNSVMVNAGLPDAKITDTNLLDLRNDFDDEYESCGQTFDDIKTVLKEAVESISVITVNMKGGTLDYLRHRQTGLHVIAIGGLALSRGLTLEGLTVSYILRNTAASDTLMQMARWFGYRPGFEEICRIFLPENSLDHYEYVEEAIAELRAEIKRMESGRQTPQDFGLKVRQSPTTLRITAANKMRSASSITVALDYSGRHIEGHVLFNDDTQNQSNTGAIQNFLEPLGPHTADEPGGTVSWEDVTGAQVLQLLSNFSFPEAHTHLGPITNSESLVYDYISDRLGAELGHWDVVIPHRKQRKNTTRIFGLTIPLRTRTSGEFNGDLWRPTGSKNRIADPDDAKLLLTPTEIDRAIAEAGSVRGDRRFCRFREKPLLIIHVIGNVGSPATSSFSGPVVSLSLCLPETDVTATPRSYQVNAVYRRQLELNLEMDDDEEVMQADDNFH
jgi:hypothetical protein